MEITRWSLSNTILPLSYGDFITMATQFRIAAENVFGTVCNVEARVMDSPKRSLAFGNDKIEQDLKERNDAHTTLVTDDLRNITKEVWKKAKYIEMRITPLDKKASDPSFAHAEFKGHHTRQATFYMQPGSDTAKKAMKAQHPSKRLGNGFKPNGTEYTYLKCWL